MDFTTINNRLYTIPSNSMIQQAAANPTKAPCFYQTPFDFWNDLGQVFIEAKSNYINDSQEGIFNSNLRELAYWLYLSWHKQIREIHREY